jgi:lipoprotein-anchoring transpeptidase ErfK/SrfK
MSNDRGTPARRRLLLALMMTTSALLSAGRPAAPAHAQVWVGHDSDRAGAVLRNLSKARSRAARPPLRFTLVETAGAVVRLRPGGRVIGTIADATPLGTPTWSWARATTRHRRWARVGLAWMPNSRQGWIRMAGRRRVHTPYWVKADLSQRRLRLMRGRRAQATFPAAIGAPSSPTPTGRFVVTDLVATGDPAGPFGSFAFGLSGHQPNLPPGWSGGDQLAIHGTNDPASIGTAASAGCFRVSEAALAALRRALRPGSPVVIER